jgi:PTS system nitrogen regulatory IIA component
MFAVEAGIGQFNVQKAARRDRLRRPVAPHLHPDEPFDYVAADGMPVDLVFGLVSPESSGVGHLHALAAISRLVRDERVHDALSEAPDAEALYGLLANAADRDAA